MVRRCAIKSCINAKENPTGTIYSFPKDQGRRSQWLQFVFSLCIFTGNPDNFGLCHLHFTETDYTLQDTLNVKKRKLHSFAEPALRLTLNTDINGNK